ncbi:MAG TPA: ABC transporter substrate-binding protein [Candidatus Dormibacteraeota bacterium]|nr:ABC transporter substrate-binding protein [Candidatus Dormibacteraeota bacterium]
MSRPNPLRLVSLLTLTMLAAACGGAASAPATTSSSHPTTSLTASYSEIIPDELAPWVASDEGYFTKNGLDVTLQSIASTNGVAALLSGQVQIAQLGGSDVLSAAAAGGDIVIVANLVPVLPYVFMVPASIDSVSQLKGKKVGVSKFGGSADIATRLGLQKNGLDPNGDVTIVATGSASNRVAALRAGAIQGAVSQPPESTTLQQQGFHVLFDLAKEKLPAANTVVATTGAYLKAHRAVVQSYVDSLVEALAGLRKDQAVSDRALGKWEQVTDPALLKDTYAFYTKEIFTAYPTPVPGQYQAAIEVLKAQNPKLATFDVSKILDPSFVKSAQSRKVGG